MLYYDKWAQIAQSALNLEGTMDPNAFISTLVGTFQTLVSASDTPVNVRDNLENGKIAKGINFSPVYNGGAIADVFRGEILKYRKRSAETRLQSMIDNYSGAKDATERAVAVSDFLVTIQADLIAAGRSDLADIVKTNAVRNGELAGVVNAIKTHKNTSTGVTNNIANNTMEKLSKPTTDSQAGYIARGIINQINAAFSTGGSVWAAAKPLEDLFSKHYIRLLLDLNKTIDIKVFFDANWAKVEELFEASKASVETQYSLEQIVKMTPSSSSFDILKKHFEDPLNALDYKSTKKDLFVMLEEIFDKKSVNDTDIALAFKIAARFQ
jgi:hypothetical protein